MEISFEYFPPKTEAGMLQLLQTTKQLSAFNPQYFSVTYGAGGSTKENTLLTVETLGEKLGNKIAPHISCLGASKETMLTLLETYKNQQIRQLIVLRGDLPSGEGSVSGDFRHANELVAFIRENYGDTFHIKVAVYPECHPQSNDIETDLYYFKQKVQAGANGAITQYFYDPNAYYWLLEACAKLNIAIPITPGIMPITNFKQLSRFSEMCGAELPRWMKKRFMAYADDSASVKQFGIEVVTNLCEQLIKMGAPGLHFYTLNKSEACLKILSRLQLTEKQHAAETVEA